ncbi:MAG TPA: zinc-ribbon domain-containing protein [Rubellimicrobium sp.]|nr:zinc-ribbon domain-containing protein [Rubellimicrobium sp.]
MRLICPNCGAQYEVPSEAIPPAGRDVQCSACGRTWFEKPPAAEPEPWDLVPRVLADEEEADDLAEAEAAPPPAASPAAPRSTVTPEVAGILRAEAEREAQVRAQEAAARSIPVTDRPVAAVSPAPQPVPPQPRSVSPAPEPVRQAARSARTAERGLDIDQINSSLRTANNRIGGKAPQVGQARRRGSFARGFWGALLVVALLAGLYVTGPAITAAVPQAGVVLTPYVAAVNNGRVWLDRQVGALLNGGAATE